MRARGSAPRRGRTTGTEGAYIHLTPLMHRVRPLRPPLLLLSPSAPAGCAAAPTSPPPMLRRSPSDAQLFDDRTDAGRQLADALGDYRDQDPVVLALPRGGVALGYEIARALGAPLDVFVARKIGAPAQPELGIGAVAPGGVTLVDQDALRIMDVSDEELHALAEEEREEMNRRLRRYRGSEDVPDVRGRTVILVDDGLATGATATAAIHALRELEPRQIVLAIAVCAPQTASALRGEVDDLVCVATPEPFRAVGLWYRDFSQTTDEEVVDLLKRAREE